MVKMKKCPENIHEYVQDICTQTQIFSHWQAQSNSIHIIKQKKNNIYFSREVSLFTK